MPITATFSNGYSDTYKGHRPVTAAWMITRRSDGEVITSGHSLDRARAARTAAGALREKGHRLGDDIPALWGCRYYPGLYPYLKRRGYAGAPNRPREAIQWMKDQNAKRAALLAERSQIEIVDL